MPSQKKKTTTTTKKTTHIFASVLKCGAITTLLLAIAIGLVLSGTARNLGLTSPLDPGIERLKGSFPFLYYDAGGEYPIHFESIPSLEGKVAIVTGANVGLGYYTSLALVRNGATVILGCRSKMKCEHAATSINQNVSSSKGGGPYAAASSSGLAIPVIVDLASLVSVRDFFETFVSNFGSEGLDILVLNAGFISGEYTETADGIESQWQVNHVGHHYLYNLLEDSLVAAAERSGHATVVSVSSAANYEVPNIPFSLKQINVAEGYVPFRRYCETKLANILFVMEAQRRVEKKTDRIFINAAHPGAVASEFLRKESVNSLLGDTLGPVLYDFAKIAIAKIAWDSETAALTQLYAAVSPEIVAKNVKATYFHPIAQRNEPNSFATMENAGRLWEETERIIRGVLVK